jgi:hypothetical protein
MAFVCDCFPNVLADKLGSSGWQNGTEQEIANGGLGKFKNQYMPEQSV